MSDGPIIGQGDLELIRHGFRRGKPSRMTGGGAWYLVDDKGGTYFTNGTDRLEFTPDNARRIYAENQVAGRGLVPLVRLGSLISRAVGGNKEVPAFPKPPEMSVERYQQLRSRLKQAR